VVPQAIARRYGSTSDGEPTGGPAPSDTPSASSDELEQISPLRGNFNQTAPRIPLGIRAGLAYQLGDCFIVKVKSASNAGAQRVESPSTPFNDRKALTVRYEQIMLLLGDDSQHPRSPFNEE
jgi:hypothetical protein